MKKNFILFFGIIVCMLISVFPFAKIKSTAFADTSVLNIKSKAYCIMDADSGSVIACENENERLPIASMCKIMTLILCFEDLDANNITLDTLISVSDTASGMGGSQVFLETNGKYSVKSLIESIVVASANDACVAMAEQICGSEELFVNKMNEKAKELGMTNTNFVNATGLPSPGQYCSAIDAAKMFRELIKHNEYFDFSRIWMDKINHPEGRITEISNTNKLIRFYQGCDGGKTGYTSEAGHCLTATAKRDDLRLISVVINAPDSKTRFNEVSSMFNYGFANYTNKKILVKNQSLEYFADILCGKQDFVKIAPEESFSLLSKKNEKLSLEIEFIPQDNLKAPINKGDIVGKIKIYNQGVEIACINALSTEDIAKEGFIDIINNIIDKWQLVA